MKMKTNDRSDQECGEALPMEPFRQALRMMSGRWTIEILFALHDGTMRFGELRRAIPGITQHMLTARLRDLETNGLVERRVFAEVPPRVEYTLTGKAARLRPTFVELRRWASENALG